MANNIEQIRYTLINGTPVGDLCDLIMYIGQQAHAPAYVKNVTYLNDILTFTKQDDTQVVTSPLVTTNTEQTISETKKFSKGIELPQGLYGIFTKDDNSYLNICGGAGVNAGCLYLYGNSTNDADAGSFKLSATVLGTIADTSKLQGYHNGNLTWTIGSNAYSILLSGTDQNIGGIKTFTDTINVKDGDGNSTGIRTTTDDSILAIYGSTAKTNGAYLYLFGKDYSNSGGFSIRANNGTNTVQLNGKADRTLTWNGYEVASTVTDISSTVTMQSTAGGTVILYKCGQLRHLVFKDVTSTTTGTVTICTLPNDSKPSSYEYFVVNGTTKGDSFASDFGTNGNVHIYGYSTAGVATYGSITYFVS